MKQYQRISESELARMIIGESHQEKFDNDLEKENEDLAYFFSNERYDDLSYVDESYFTWPRQKGCEFDDEGYLIDYDDWTDDEIFDCVNDDSEESFGHDDWDMEDEFNDEYDRAYLQNEEEEPFPKHLEYKMDRFGYPIIESRKNYDEDEEINPLELAKEIRNIIFGDKEESSQLMKMLRARHHLSPNKRI